MDQYLVIGCIVAYASIYIRGIVNAKIKPILSTWIFFFIAVFLSSATTYSHGDLEGVMNNIFNTVDNIAVVAILLTVLCSKHTTLGFKNFETILLGCVIAIGVAWYFSSGYDVVANLLIQIILLIAYIPMIKQLRGANSHHESIPMRTINCIGACVGTIQPIIHQDSLAIIYTMRSILCTLFVVLLLVKIEYKK